MDDKTQVGGIGDGRVHYSLLARDVLTIGCHRKTASALWIYIVVVVVVVKRVFRGLICYVAATACDEAVFQLSLRRRGQFVSGK